MKVFHKVSLKLMSLIFPSRLNQNINGRIVFLVREAVSGNILEAVKFLISRPFMLNLT